MAIITSHILIRSLSILHLTLSYYLFTRPAAILDLNLVVVLGSSMNLPYPPESSFPASGPTAATSLAAVAIAYLAISDFIGTSSLSEVAYDEYWGAQVPLRLLGLFGLEAWIYLTGRRHLTGALLVNEVERAGLSVKNSVMFTFLFIEIMTLFWSFVKLREERKALAERLKKERTERNSL